MIDLLFIVAMITLILIAIFLLSAGFVIAGHTEHRDEQAGPGFDDSANWEGL